MAALTITNKNYVQEIISAKMAVLLDVYTPNCGPCKAMSPIIDKLSDELKSKIKIVKLNASEDNDLASSLRVSAVPTLVAFREGVEVARKTGFQTEPKLRAWIEEVAEGDIVRKEDV
jgi:thioredoxin 1